MNEKYEPQTVVMLFKEIKEDLKAIHEQTAKTNGRVSNLEKWRSYVMGGLAMLTILMLPILFIVVSDYLSKTSITKAQTYEKSK